MAAFALLTFGMVSCERDDGQSNNDNQITPNPTSGQWVDLGLPSGLLWYSVNLGATAPEQYGDYYAWAEIQPKSIYTWKYYTYGGYESGSDTYTIYKYNTKADYGTVDNLTTLQPADDAATQQLGDGARIPTESEWYELIDNTTIEWTTLNNVKGRKYTAPNGNSIFLPAARGRNGSESFGFIMGHYWTASLHSSNNNPLLNPDDPSNACEMQFDDVYFLRSFPVCRAYGLSVRAVRSRSQN